MHKSNLPDEFRVDGKSFLYQAQAPASTGMSAPVT